MQEVPASSIPVLTDVLAPGKPTAQAEGRLPVLDVPVSMPPVLTDVLVPGSRATDRPEALPPVLTEVLAPGRRAVLGAEAASMPPLLTDVLTPGKPVSVPLEVAEASVPVEPVAVSPALAGGLSTPGVSALAPPLLTDVLRPGTPERVAAARTPVSDERAVVPSAMPLVLTDVLVPGKPETTLNEAVVTPLAARRAEAVEAASPTEPPMPPTLTDMLELGKPKATSIEAIPAPPLADRAEASAVVSPAEPPPILTDVPVYGNAEAAPNEAAIAPPMAGRAEPSVPTPPQSASPSPTSFPGRPLPTSPLLAGTASREAPVPPAPTDDVATSHEPARPTELTPPADGVDIQPVTPAATPAAELLTAFDAPSAFADELPASHSAPEPVAPPPLASFVAAAADARVDARDIAGRLQRRVADYLGGAGRALIEARCEAALRDHGARLVDEVTREVARTLEAEIAGWVREAVDDELARRAARGADAA